MKPRRLLPFSAAITCVLTIHAHAVERIKQNNTTALNLAGAWDTAPTSSDVAVWNSTVTASQASGSNTITALGGDLSWQGIKITNVAGTANPSATTAGIQITNGSSANTLTLGSGGIDMSNATQALMIQSKIALSGNQTWNIKDANTNGAPFAGSGINAGMSEDLLFSSQASGGSQSAFDFGGRTVDTTGAGAIGITSGYALSNGTLNLGNANTWIQSGGSKTTSLASSLSVTVAANSNLRLRANSGAGGIGINSAAPISVSGTNSRLQLEVNNGSNSLIQSGKVTLGNNSTLENIVNNTGAFTLSGEIATSGTNTWQVNGTNAGHASGVAFSGNLTGNGVVAYQNTASGTNGQVRMSGDNSGFTGTLNLNGGSNNRSLRLTTATAGSSSATWTVGTGNILQVDGVAVNLGTLNGAGTVTNSHASNVAAITVGAGTFSGAITNGTPLLGMSLTKNTVGTLTLSGNGNSYTGNTLISGGKLVATQTGAISTSSAISVNGTGAIFDGTGTFGAVSVADNLGTVQNGNGTSGALTLSSLTFAGDATLNIVTSSSTPSARVVVTGALTTTPGSGTITVNGSGSWTNGVNNLLSYGSGSALLSDFTAGTFTGFTSRQSSGGLSLSGNNLFLTVIGDSPKWTGSDNGNWVVGPTGANGNWQLIGAATQTDFITNDIVLFDDTAPGTKTVNVSAANVSVASADFNTSTAYTLTGGFGISAGTIAKNGSGSLTIENANTTSGGVQLNAGTLNVNNNGALGTGTLAIAGGTSLDNTSGSAKVATNAQNWNGDFTFAGSNDLTLGSAAMNASRQVTVSAGTLTVGGISGTGFGLTKAGAGTLAVGSSSYSGATVVNGGTLKATSGTSFTTTYSITLANTAGVALDLNGNSQTIGTITGGGAAGGDILLNGAVLTTGTAADNTFAGDLVGAGGLTKQGAGTLTLSGDKSGYSGATSISGGTLDVGTVSSAFGTGNITGSNTIFFQGNGSTTTGITGGSSGIGARGGNFTVNVGGAAAIVQMTSSGGNGLGGFNFGSATSDSTVIVQNDVGINNFNGTRNITVNPGTGSASAEITGVISNGAAGGNNGIVKLGTGDLILSNANTFTGTTTINAGRIVLGHAQALQFSALNTASVGKVTVTGYATPTLGGLTGSTDLATVIDTGFSGITTLTLNPQTGQSQSYSGVIADGATGMNLVKSGGGTQTLTNAQTYTGSTTVSAGTLALTGNGSISTSSNYIVNGTLDVSAITPSSFTIATGKTLSGTGTVNATGKTLSIEGKHAVGNNSIGQQSISGTASYAAGSIFEWQLGSNVENGTWDHDNDGGTTAINTRGTAFDAVNVTGDLNIDGTASTGAVFKIILGTDFDGGDSFWLANRSWDVFTATTSSTNFTNFQLYNSGDLVNQVSYDTFGNFSYGFTGGTGTLSWSAVPEPTSALAGLLLSAGLLRRRRN